MKDRNYIKRVKSMKKIFVVGLSFFLITTSAFADNDPLLLSDAEMQKLHAYFPAQDSHPHLAWSGDPIHLELPMNHEKRIVFPCHVTVDVKGQLTTDQLKVLNDDKSIYLTALKPFSTTRIYVTTQDTNEVVLIDLMTNEKADAETINIDLKQNNPQASSSNAASVATNTNNESVSVGEEGSAPAISDNETDVNLVRYAWQQLFAPTRLVNTALPIVRAPMHTQEFSSTLIYGDKVIAHPLISWVYGDTYVTAVELRNKYSHPTSILLNRDLCGDWQAATLYPRTYLKALGNKSGDSVTLFLVSKKPFENSMEVVMAAHNTNSLLKYALPVVVLLLMIVGISSCVQRSSSENTKSEKTESLTSPGTVKNNASNDSAAESLDTLTAELASTKETVTQNNKDFQVLKQQNDALIKKLDGKQDAATSVLSQQLDALKNQMAGLGSKSSTYAINNANSTQAITTVDDLTTASSSNKTLRGAFGWNDAVNHSDAQTNSTMHPEKPKSIPCYTIPANATAVDDKLMSALVGRIPVKGVVTDPYPFKIVFSNDTLAANGWRVPNLKQMVVSGYAEGDLNLLAVRGWVTSLTFVFADGRICPASSNNNDVGHFTKENALGYLSDLQGNPFICGRLVTNAPGYLAGNVALGAAQGAASAFTQSQVTNQNSMFGTVTSAVTGSAGKYVLGQAAVGAAGQAQQWWTDREQNSFDAIYVIPGGKIVVNFTKEIQIDYNFNGRKIVYANPNNSNECHGLD